MTSTLSVSEDTADSKKGLLQNNGRDYITTQLVIVDNSYAVSIANTNADSANTDRSAFTNAYNSYGISGV